MKVVLHALAPEKPVPGAQCNGCGVCCGIAPCPLSRVLLKHRSGPCPALTWQEGRYACGLVVAPTGVARWLPRAFVLRWIAAGKGCDCAVEIDG